MLRNRLPKRPALHHETARQHRRRSGGPGMGNQAPVEDWLNPRWSLQRTPMATRRLPDGAYRCRSRGASFALRPHPPKWAGVRARRNLTEQPTSRLCSADESVVTSRRCQRPATRSFHGLCFPFKVPQLPLHPGDAVPKGGPCDRPKPAVRAPRPSPVAASYRGVEPMGSLRGFTLPASRRSGGRDGRRGGPKPSPARRLFSAWAGAPRRSLASTRDRDRVRGPG
jgi:hypothetical protein